MSRIVSHNKRPKCERREQFNANTLLSTHHNSGALRCAVNNAQHATTHIAASKQNAPAASAQSPINITFRTLVVVFVTDDVDSVDVSGWRRAVSCIAYTYAARRHYVERTLAYLCVWACHLNSECVHHAKCMLSCYIVFRMHVSVCETRRLLHALICGWFSGCCCCCCCYVV